MPFLRSVSVSISYSAPLKWCMMRCRRCLTVNYPMKSWNKFMRSASVWLA
ncbi:Uncharacterised protein [Vibrio cholerae]|nr:Uncharacterised protein [Vibrio cholerae]